MKNFYVPNCNNSAQSLLRRTLYRSNVSSKQTANVIVKKINKRNLKGEEKKPRLVN
ncbi:MAG TPA: hypothetical protein VN958_06620 [Chitinophagaceae bacterium]|nr:hypothetical protein [Chitinophagaceae bacterium]